MNILSDSDLIYYKNILDSLYPYVATANWILAFLIILFLVRGYVKKGKRTFNILITRFNQDGWIWIAIVSLPFLQIAKVYFGNESLTKLIGAARIILLFHILFVGFLSRFINLFINKSKRNIRTKREILHSKIEEINEVKKVDPKMDSPKWLWIRFIFSGLALMLWINGIYMNCIFYIENHDASLIWFVIKFIMLGVLIHTTFKELKGNLKLIVKRKVA